MTVTLSHRTHALYRFFDLRGRLLYIGLTVDLPARLTRHRLDKPWWSDVARVEVEHYPSRAAVAAAERSAIATETPLYNVVHNHGREELPTRTRPPWWPPAEQCELAAICDTCQRHIAAGNGVIHISMREVAVAERSMRQWESENSGPLLRVSDLMSMPEEARWKVECLDCLSPRDNPDFDNAEACYFIEIERCLTWAELIEWTVHLSEKDWVRSTDWMFFIGRAARGEDTTGLVPLGACPVRPQMSTHASTHGTHGTHLRPHPPP
jgi:predicted GIY-YIG superfamily endonuclease